MSKPSATALAEQRVQTAMRYMTEAGYKPGEDAALKYPDVVRRVRDEFYSTNTGIHTGRALKTIEKAAARLSGKPGRVRGGHTSRWGTFIIRPAIDGEELPKPLLEYVRKFAEGYRASSFPVPVAEFGSYDISPEHVAAVEHVRGVMEYDCEVYKVGAFYVGLIGREAIVAHGF